MSCAHVCLNAADSKPNNRFPPSNPVSYPGHTTTKFRRIIYPGVLPLNLEDGPVLSFFLIANKFWSHNFSTPSNANERKTNKLIVEEVCTTNHITSAITRYVKQITAIHNNQCYGISSVRHRGQIGTIEDYSRAFRMITFVPQLF